MKVILKSTGAMLEDFCVPGQDNAGILQIGRIISSLAAKTSKPSRYRVIDIETVLSKSSMLNQQKQKVAVLELVDVFYYVEKVK